MRLISYREPRRQPLWQLGLGVTMTLSLAIAWGTAAGSTLGWLTGICTTTAVVAWWWLKSATIEVSPSGLKVGAWFLESDFLGQCQALNAEDFLRRTRDLARADDALSLQGVARSGVLVEVLDSSDTYRHWLISSKRPQALADSLNSLKSS